MRITEAEFAALQSRVAASPHCRMTVSPALPEAPSPISPREPRASRKVTHTPKVEKPEATVAPLPWRILANALAGVATLALVIVAAAAITAGLGAVLALLVL